MAGKNEQLRGYASEFIGVAKQFFGEMIGSQKRFDEGSQQKSRGEARVERGKV